MNHLNHSNHANQSNHANHANHSNHANPANNLNVNPCTDFLTDLEYIEHMIPHHQVAVDMSYMLIPNTQDPIILNLCRNIIRKQKYEIWEMNHMKRQLNDKLFSDEKKAIDTIYSKLDKYEPLKSKSRDGDCNPLFFKPDDHASHMKGMDVTPKSYLEHMIPHHQVAVDMSKRLLMYTDNSYLIDFCRKLITDQQGEILFMNDLLEMKKTWNFNSELLN